MVYLVALMFLNFFASWSTVHCSRAEMASVIVVVARQYLVCLEKISWNSLPELLVLLKEIELISL
jgi:hypothetical protein